MGAAAGFTDQLVKRRLYRQESLNSGEGEKHEYRREGADRLFWASLCQGSAVRPSKTLLPFLQNLDRKDSVPVRVSMDYSFSGWVAGGGGGS